MVVSLRSRGTCLSKIAEDKKFPQMGSLVHSAATRVGGQMADSCRFWANPAPPSERQVGDGSIERWRVLRDHERPVIRHAEGGLCLPLTVPAHGRNRLARLGLPSIPLALAVLRVRTVDQCLPAGGIPVSYTHLTLPTSDL